MSKKDLPKRIRAIFAIEDGTRTIAEIANEMGYTEQAIGYWVNTRTRNMTIMTALNYYGAKDETELKDLLYYPHTEENIGMANLDTENQVKQDLKDKNKKIVYLTDQVHYYQNLLRELGIDPEKIPKKKDMKQLFKPSGKEKKT
jgi:predicted transcriptional regulator